jgi:predicted metal-dependent phosphoesterase TrpH
MNEFRADLHCHSNCSDGSLSPEALLHLAKQIGLSALSITDHDTVEAYSTAQPISKELGILLITGVEFSAAWDNVSVHILGYGFRVDDPKIQAFCLAHTKRRFERNQAIIAKLNTKGMPLTYEEVLAAAARSPDNSEKKTIGRPHIALAMKEKGYVETIQQAFKLHIGEECPCYVQGTLFSAADTIEVIHQAAGVAVIAHPHLIRNETVLAGLLKLNFDGIECYYGSNLSKNNERWIKIAHAKKWLKTGGSDYHGINRPDERLGSSWVDQETLQVLQARIQK